MAEIEMLCLANSRKHGRRCVAGVLTDGTWVRPVSATEDGALAESDCRLDAGRPVRPLDVVRFSVERDEPRPHQPENRLITDEQWQLLRSRDLADVASFLDGCAYDKPSIVGTTSRSVSWEEVQREGVTESLALVKVAEPMFDWSEYNPTQLRATFTYAGTTYDLPNTFEDALPLGRSSSEWYLTISLGEPFARQGNDCYKLVAGAIEIP